MPIPGPARYNLGLYKAFTVMVETHSDHCVQRIKVFYFIASVHIDDDHIFLSIRFNLVQASGILNSNSAALKLGPYGSLFEFRSTKDIDLLKHISIL